MPGIQLQGQRLHHPIGESESETETEHPGLNATRYDRVYSQPRVRHKLIVLIRKTCLNGLYQCPCVYVVMQNSLLKV